MNPLTPIDYAVAWAITHIHGGLSIIFGPASGWAWAGAIVILVMLMRLILVPLFIKQLHATRKMSALAPQIAELKKKYKNDKQKLNEETMRLYKENGANPLAGCLPMVLQFPLFFALFDVLRGIAEWNPHATPYKPPPYGLSPGVVESAQHAHILGATVADRFLVNLFPPTLDNIPHTSQIVIFVFVAISATTTFLTVRQSTKRGMNPQMTPDNPMSGMQKYMAYFAPLFALSGLYWQFGLVLYWVTTNLWTLGQQYVLFKRYPTPAPAGAAPVTGATAPALTKRPGKAAEAKGTTAAGGARKGAAGKGQAGPAVEAPPPAVKTGGGAPRAGKKPGGAPAGGARSAPGPAKTSANGNGNGTGGGGMLRRLGRGRAEAEPEPAPPPVKLVRQQRVRQSRSKRSGKR